uniref:Uncharacterized protein n=1 Tax=Timema douglasi TaxID=61478 RepID=A0A7R8ZDV0_TIMDO|nr:unnamed protein product [Timema douglasi]
MWRTSGSFKLQCLGFNSSLYKQVNFVRMTECDTDISYFSHKLKMCGLSHFKAESNNTNLLVDKLLKSFLQEKGVSACTKINIASFLELEARNLLFTVSDIELTYSTFKGTVPGDHSEHESRKLHPLSRQTEPHGSKWTHQVTPPLPSPLSNPRTAVKTSHHHPKHL